MDQYAHTARRREQLRVLAEAGVLDDAARAALEPTALPPAIATAFAVARRGGPGWRHAGRVVGSHLRRVVGEHEHEIDAAVAASSEVSRRMLLGEVLRTRAPAILAAIEPRHLAAVLDAAASELTEAGHG